MRCCLPRLNVSFDGFFTTRYFSRDEAHSSSSLLCFDGRRATVPVVYMTRTHLSSLPFPVWLTFWRALSYTHNHGGGGGLFNASLIFRTGTHEQCLEIPSPLPHSPIQQYSVYCCTRNSLRFPFQQFRVMFSWHTQHLVIHTRHPHDRELP